MNNTFVTAFIDLHENRSKDKSYNVFITHFLHIIETGLNIVLFISKTFLPLIESHYQLDKKKNLFIIQIEFEELETYQFLKDVKQLPYNRTLYHDTLAFLILMNSKIEFVKRAIDINHFQSENFAWIDFGIAHVLKYPKETLGKLSCLNKIKNDNIIMPGCWPINLSREMIYDMVQWRFCGGFFFSSKKGMLDFYEKSCSFYKNENKKVTWEVNVWQYLEMKGDITPIWYTADHNDTIISNFPFHLSI